jgi:hypothetical protein
LPDVEDPTFLNNRLIDGGEVVSLTRSLQEDSWYSFLVEAESAPGPASSGDLVGNRIRDLPACSKVPQPIMLLRSA